jgi:hypothetical protein
MRSLAFVLVACAACTGDPPPNSQNKCAGSAFDLCSTEHDCTSANCHLFSTDGFQVCTQMCDATSPCPNDATGAPAMCNAMGICKPAMANDCHL